MSFGHKNEPLQQNSVWAVGGGKGGIGKSFISSSLAICLARLGKSVILVDLDLGSANLHTCLGAKTPQQTLSDFVSGKTTDLTHVMVDTEIPGLRLISGLNDSLDIANISTDAKNKIISRLRSLPASYVILDLGAGTSEHTLDFFLAADQKIVAVSPEPTSIENAYRFMKSSYFRILKNAEAELGIQDLLATAMDSRAQHGIRSPSDLLKFLIQSNPEVGKQLQERINDLKVQLLINQVRTRQDIDLGHSMKSVSFKYFGIHASYLGHIDHDNAVWQSLRKRRPMVVEYPYSAVVGQFLNITKNLLNPHSLKAVV
jgi:flagellar biosynthesis protein FlhG